MKNIALLAFVAFVFWHLFGRKGDGALPAPAGYTLTTPPDPAAPLPTENTDHNAIATGDVQTTEETP